MRDAVFGQLKGEALEERTIVSGGDVVAMTVTTLELQKLSEVAHEEFNRCGGFMMHEDEQFAVQHLDEQPLWNTDQVSLLSDYSIDQANTVQNAMAEVSEPNIRSVIEKLSSYNNRYYKSQTGYESQLWVFEKWKEIANGRSDINVYRFRHNSWDQDTIVAEIKGLTDNKIVVGGHGDSIAGWWGKDRAHAPGADDNASGVATTTEVFRVLVDSGYRPQNTIVFASYAAEEVGLLGSKEMAQSFKDNGENVLGVLQLDMTNFNGSDWDIVLISDFTNKAQNEFLGGIIDTYLPELTWGYDRCGYGCSDHASWTSAGFPSSMPFEAKKRESNGHIHSSRDTLAQSGNKAEHAAKFAKMGLAFVIELDN